MSLIVEFIIVASGLLIALVAPRSFTRVRAFWGRWFRRVCGHRSTALLVSGLVPFALVVGLAARSGIPLPYVHDEFVYLLTGETFARGQLTNPTPEHYEYIQSPHILMKPTYQGKYPPGQGLVLALGTVLCGYPIVGVWLSFAAASVAICWMLMAWVPTRWALLGALLFGLHPQISQSWGETYWGGAVASTGGALLFGSILRLERRASVLISGCLGLSLVILANSRPYEGAILALIGAVRVAAILLGRLRTQDWDGVVKMVIPPAMVVLAGASWIGIYNKAVTGSIFRMPYQEWISQNGYDGVSGLLMRDGLTRLVSASGTPDSAIPLWRFKVLRHHLFFLGTALAVPVMAAWWTRRRRGVAIAFVAYSLVYIAVVINPHSGWPHYYAPAVPLLFSVIIHGLRQLSVASQRGRSVATVCLVAFGAGACVSDWNWMHDPYPSGKHWVFARKNIEKALKQNDTGDVIAVRYSRQHDPGDEWVWNTGLPQTQDVIWVHSLGAAGDKTLFTAYPKRDHWILDVGEAGCRLERHGPGMRASDRKLYFRYENVPPFLAVDAERSESNQEEPEPAA